MYRRSESIVTGVVDGLCKAIDSPFARNYHDVYHGSRFRDLLDHSIDPSDYRNPQDFRDDYLLLSVLSKADFLPTGIDTKAAALLKFQAAEVQCRETNVRLRSLGNSASIYSAYTPWSILRLAALKIGNVLGPVNWDEISTHFGFGPGSTTQVSRRHGDAYFKFGVVRPHSTFGNLAAAWAAVRSVPRWYQSVAQLPHDCCPISSFSKDEESLFEVVPGNKVTTVPKNAKTDRIIAVEPDMNIYVQLGLGRVIQSRLRRVGIDLTDQSRNQRLAKEGSITGNLSTLDLSSASDTVSYELVRLLLPADWVNALEQARSPFRHSPFW